jgi:hypothetical protein
MTAELGACAHAPRMETETDVGTLRFRCPRTSREVDSGIDTDRDTRFLARLFSIRVRCPICGDLHEWRVAAGMLPWSSRCCEDEHATSALAGSRVPRQEREEADERLLLDELNDRMQSNVQMLCGLLQAAWRETASSEARAVLLDTWRRVAALGAAQQALCAGDAGDANTEPISKDE